MSEKSFVEHALAHLPRLVRVGRRLTGSDVDAEDLAQETLVRALEKRHELREPERLAGWLLAVQRTVWLNGRRGLRRRFEVLDGGLGAAPEPTGNLEREIVGTGISDEVEHALSTLPAEWREALWLREVEELSYDEIAVAQGCPTGTVRSRLARARAAVADALDAKRRNSSESM